VGGFKGTFWKHLEHLFHRWEVWGVWYILNHNTPQTSHLQKQQPWAKTETSHRWEIAVYTGIYPKAPTISPTVQKLWYCTYLKTIPWYCRNSKQQYRSNQLMSKSRAYCTSTCMLDIAPGCLPAVLSNCFIYTGIIACFAVWTSLRFKTIHLLLKKGLFKSTFSFLTSKLLYCGHNFLIIECSLFL